MLRYAFPSIARCRAGPCGKAIHTLQPKTLPSAHLHRQAHCCGSSRGQLQPSAAAVSARHFSSKASSQRPRVPQRTRGRVTYLTRAAGATEPEIQSEFEPVTGTWQYIIADPATKKAAIIDPVLDFDPATQAITTSTADSLLSLIAERGYSIERILETHIHADHLTSASYLRKRLAEIQGQRPTIGVGKRIDQVQKVFSKRYAIPPSEYQDAFQTYFDDDEEFSLGNLMVRALHLPGHTPDHLGYKVGDNVFVGDSLFHFDIGSARCDFPGGSAHSLYQSGRKLLSLPGATRIWTGHDYPPDGRDPVAAMTVQEHLERNKHFRNNATEDEYVAARQERDSQMGAPRLLHQSLQINLRAGRLPTPTDSQDRLLHLPLKLNGLSW